MNPAYEKGYQDGENSVLADLDLLLDEDDEEVLAGVRRMVRNNEESMRTKVEKSVTSDHFNKFTSTAITKHECASQNYIVRMEVERKTEQSMPSGGVQVRRKDNTPIFSGNLVEFLELIDICHYASGQARIKHDVKR